MAKIDWREAFEALAAEYGLLDRLITSLDANDLMVPSGCQGWSNADLIFHMLLDAQRALVTFNSPASGPADKDLVTYWAGFQASDENAQAHSRFVRISSSAHQDLMGLAARWQETAQAAVRCAGATRDIPFVTTQSHILPTPDFIATLVVEATIHHLDLLSSLADHETPAPAALAITRRTLDGLLKEQEPIGWDDVTYIFKGTGRQPLDEDEREALGAASERFPLFS